MAIDSCGGKHWREKEGWEVGWGRVGGECVLTFLMPKCDIKVRHGSDIIDSNNGYSNLTMIMASDGLSIYPILKCFSKTWHKRDLLSTVKLANVL